MDPQFANMEATGKKHSINDEIHSISLHNPRPIVFHGYVFPFIFLHGGWLYTWVTSYGVEDYFEVGMIVFAIIGLLQVLTTLFCMWFVQVQVILTCSRVCS